MNAQEIRFVFVAVRRVSGLTDLAVAHDFYKNLPRFLGIAQRPAGGRRVYSLRGTSGTPEKTKMLRLHLIVAAELAVGEIHIAQLQKPDP